MKTQAYFTCQVQPGSFILQNLDFHKSKRKIIAQTKRISGWTLLFIMAIASFSTFNRAHGALIKSLLQFKETQIDEDMVHMVNSGMNALAAINNTPTEKKIFSILKNADFIPQKASKVEQFPLYVPFSFFFLGFIFVLAHHWILLKSRHNKKEKDHKAGLKEAHEQNSKQSNLIVNFQS